jgi:hypothetical protein
VADYLSAWQEIIRRGIPPGLRRETLLRKVRKLGVKWAKVGVNVSEHPQRKLCEAIADSAGQGPLEDPTHKDPRSWMLKFCMARLIRGDFSDWTGWEYRNEWATQSYHPAITGRRWRLEPVQSIAVLGEQGIGDEIMFASCLRDLKVPEVVVECDPRLQSVLERAGYKTRPRADIVNRSDDKVKYLTAERPEEKFIPIGDLPRLFRKSLASFPRVTYLTPRPDMVEKWSHLKGRTGVAWRSRTGKIEPEAFDVRDAVCLQYDAWEFETEGMYVPEINLKNDIEDLLGICANLDRVVSVPQTIVHLAGSIGTKVDVVMPPVGSNRVVNQMPYRYIDPMPWYPQVRVHDSIHGYRRSRT